MPKERGTPRLSLVTTCKGRLADLKESLRSWLALEGAYEIVVVDYDCPDGTADYVEARREAWLETSVACDVRAVRVADKPFFNLNDARNRGLREARAPVAMTVDSDVTILRRDLPAWVAEEFARGKAFLGNIPVLHSLILEGRLFFRYQYDTEVEVPLALPLLSEHIGLTGTACFLREEAVACGLYDPAVNEAGYGCDDIEFYLRYLNRLVRRDPSGGGIAARLDAFLERTLLFPEGWLDTKDNPEEDKHRFYRLPAQDSAKGNRHFIGRTVAALAERYGQEERPAPRPLILGRDWPPELPGNIPPWFPCWFYYWYGVQLAARGLLAAHSGEFPEGLWDDGEEARLANGGNRHRYRMASLAFRLGQDGPARALLEALLADPGEDSVHLRSGAHYFLGEIGLRNGRGADARAHFEACLAQNPLHRAAREGLARLSEDRTGREAAP